MSFNNGLDLSMANGKVPLALIKSVSFLETLTNLDLAENAKVNESVLFILEITDLCGIINLIASVLLADALKSTKLLP